MRIRSKHREVRSGYPALRDDSIRFHRLCTCTPTVTKRPLLQGKGTASVTRRYHSQPKCQAETGLCLLISDGVRTFAAFTSSRVALGTRPGVDHVTGHVDPDGEEALAGDDGGRLEVRPAEGEIGAGVLISTAALRETQLSEGPRLLRGMANGPRGFDRKGPTPRPPRRPYEVGKANPIALGPKAFLPLILPSG